MLADLRTYPAFFLRPAHLLRSYQRSNLRPDIVAGLTVAVILLPQAMAYALIAELPPQVGLYTAIVAAIVGALWGSSHHLQTGPTNAISLLILSTLFTITAPGTLEYIILAGLMAVMVGVIQLLMGLARLGVLVNFVSHSVIVGFASGAGVLIAIQQVRHLLGLDFSSHRLLDAGRSIIIHLPETHAATLALGLGTILLIVLLRRINRKLPGPLIAMIAAAIVVGVLGLDQAGVVVIGELPKGLPPVAKLPLLDLQLIGQLAPGALAVAAIGLVEAMSIARSIASLTDQRLDSNQEFVGQGLANLAAGFFSGYPGSGSFTRSAVNYKSGGQTPLASAFSGIFVLIAMLVFSPYAAFVPRTALAGVLIVTAYDMIDRAEIARIWRGARPDAAIMIVTFLATLFLPLEFAVLSGILLSFGIYVMKTSVPRVSSVLPDEHFRHFTRQEDRPACPQLAILDIRGDLYFGAVNHIETAINRHLVDNSEQRYLLLRLHSVEHCDFSGVHALESIARICHERGGDLFLVRVHRTILEVLKAIGFRDYLGKDHFLSEDEAIHHLFHKVLDPAICIYECDVRAFRECQNLPRPTYQVDVPRLADIPEGSVASVAPEELWQQLCSGPPPLVIDVREPREFVRGHVPQAQLIPLPELLAEQDGLPQDQPIVLVCRGGRRSTRAAYVLNRQGHDNVQVLRGGLLAWKASGLLEALAECD